MIWQSRCHLRSIANVACRGNGRGERREVYARDRRIPPAPRAQARNGCRQSTTAAVGPHAQCGSCAGIGEPEPRWKARCPRLLARQANHPPRNGKTCHPQEPKTWTHETLPAPQGGQAGGGDARAWCCRSVGATSSARAVPRRCVAGPGSEGHPEIGGDKPFAN